MTDTEHERAALNERRSRARVKRRSRFSLKSASWAPLAIFMEERKLNAAQILNLKVLNRSKIKQIPLLFAKNCPTTLVNDESGKI